MPDLLKMAFLATEDRRFYNHDGLDFIGLGRAIMQDILHMNLSQGGSPITQQLARNLYLNGDKTLSRKVNEISIAMALEKKYSKDEILEMYLNQIYMMPAVWCKRQPGRYFGIKDMHQLKLWHIVATLVGMPKGPSIYNPVDHPELSKQRRAVILGLMHEQGLITRKQMLQARDVDFTPPETVLNATTSPGLSEPAYVSAVDAVIHKLRLTGKSEAEIQSAGWVIQTGLDEQAQLAMEETFADATRFPDHCQDEQVQASMVIIDQHNGEVKAMMGGRNPLKGGINRAIMDARQPGSSFKPIIAQWPCVGVGKVQAREYTTG